MIPLINCTSKIGAYTIITLNAIAALWTNCVFIMNLKKSMNCDFSYLSQCYRFEHVLLTIQLTYLLLFIIVNLILIRGFRKSSKRCLIPWCNLKICEFVVIIFGTIMLFMESSYDGLILLGLITLALNIYLSLSVYKGYKKIRIIQMLKTYENELQGILHNNNETEQTDIEDNIKNKEIIKENNDLGLITEFENKIINTDNVKIVQPEDAAKQIEDNVNIYQENKEIIK